MNVLILNVTRYYNSSIQELNLELIDLFILLLKFNIVNTHINITLFLQLITLEKYNTNFIKRIQNFLLPITAAN